MTLTMQTSEVPMCTGEMSRKLSGSRVVASMTRLMSSCALQLEDALDCGLSHSFKRVALRSEYCLKRSAAA